MKGYLRSYPANTMNKHKKLSAKLFLALILGISLVITTSLYIEFRLSKSYINYQTQSFIANNIRYQTNEIKEELETLKRLSENISALIYSLEMDSVQIEQLHRLIFNLSEEIHGIGIYYMKNTHQTSIYKRYYCREFDTIGMLQTMPYNQNELLSNPQRNAPVSVHSVLGDTLFVFYSSIISQSDHSNLLLTVDFLPKFVYTHLEKVARLYKSKYVILNRSEEVLFHNYESSLKKGGLDELWKENIKPKLSSIEFLDSSNETFIQSKEFNRKESVFILPLSNIGWYCIFFIPAKLDQTLVRHFFLISILSILAIVITGLIISYYSKKITGPLSIISAAVKSLENGNLYNPLPEIETDDELEDLAKSFQKVQAKMQHYAFGFKTSLEEKRAMARDLRMANRIQESMLPDQFKGLTDFPDINLFTRLVPAKGVAGDFFDYCFLSAHRFFFIVGDVSGKGIPAALYMVKVLTLLRTQKIRSLPLHQMFTEISNVLNSVNKEGTFVTAIGGILNYKTGELILCDAGHNPPFISKAGEAFDYFEIKKNVPLGVTVDYTYNETKLHLKTKDTLFLYTDGLSEAVNEKGNMFENERIVNALADHQDKKLEVIFNYLKNSLLSFVGKAKQADDITVFLLRYMK